MMPSVALRTPMGALVACAMLSSPAAAWGRAEGPAAPRAEPAPAVAVGSLAPSLTDGSWTKQRRKLQIQTGLSAGFSAGFLLSGLLLLFAPAVCRDPDPDFGCGEGYGRLISALVVLPASVVAAIPTAVYGVRLTRHNRQRPVARLRLAPGGLALNF